MAKFTAFFIIVSFVFISQPISAQDNAGNELLRHVVIVKFKPSASNMQILQVDKSFKNLAEKLPVVKSFEWGTVIDEHDTIHIKHLYVTTFKSKKEEAIYGASPEHQVHIKLGADYIAGVTATDYFVNRNDKY